MTKGDTAYNAFFVCRAEQMENFNREQTAYKHLPVLRLAGVKYKQKGTSSLIFWLEEFDDLVNGKCHVVVILKRMVRIFHRDEVDEIVFCKCF